LTHNRDSKQSNALVLATKNKETKQHVHPKHKRGTTAGNGSKITVVGQLRLLRNTERSYY